MKFMHTGVCKTCNEETEICYIDNECFSCGLNKITENWKVKSLSVTHKELIEEYIINHVSDTHCTHSELIGDIKHCYDNKDIIHDSEFHEILRDSCIGEVDLLELTNKTWDKYCVIEPVFQFESTNAMDLLKEMKPKSMQELSEVKPSLIYPNTSLRRI